jgi:hypothetical protein
MRTRYLGALAAAFSLLCSMAALGEDGDRPQLRSSIDRDYRKTYQYYLRIYAEDKRQIRDFYMNRVMVNSIAKGGTVPVGAIVVLEVYGARVGNDGQPLLDSDGKMMPGPLNVISVMETIDGANRYFPFDVSNGEWIYFFYTDNFEDKTTAEDRLACMQCHKKSEGSQFIFTYNAMSKAVR